MRDTDDPAASESATSESGAGDPTASLQQRLGARHPVAAVATVAQGVVTTRVIGAPADSDFELCSISKGLTGLLYADACERGEVRPETTLGELLSIGDSRAASVTLASIATHTSGLPRLPPGMQAVRRTLRLWQRGTNPYGESLDELLEQARRVTLASPRPRYSNFGFELLGHALAAGAGLGYRALLDERLAAPLGLSSVYAPSRPDELRGSSLLGRDRRGRTVEPWTGEAIAPAGGIRSNIGDMAVLATALLDGSAPGVAALDPVANFAGPAVRLGAAWVTIEVKGRTITWHNGGSGGFCTWIGLDREAGTAVVLLSARAISVDRHGFALLRELGA